MKKLVIAAAGLYLLSRVLGQNAVRGGGGTLPGGRGDGSFPANTNTAPVDNTTRDIELGAKITGLAVTGAGIVVSALTAGGVIGGGAGTAAAAGGAAAGGGGAGAGGAGGGSAAVTGTLAISPIGIVGGAAVVIILAAAISTTLAFKAVADMAESASNFVKSTIGPNPAYFFRQFMANMTVNGARPATMRDVPPALVRKLVLASMWLWYSPQKYANDILYAFYVNTGYPEGRRPTRMYAYSLGYDPNAANQQVTADFGAQFMSKSAWGRWGSQFTTSNASAVSEFWNSFGLGLTEAGALGLPSSAAMPASLGEMEAAAREILGVKYDEIIGLLHFNEAVSSLAFAGQQIWTQGQYPGDAVFTQDLQRVMLPSWQYVQGNFWTLEGRNSGGDWLVDPKTGNRVNPAQIRRHWQIQPFVSIKGMVFSGTPNYPAGSVYGHGLVPGQIAVAGFGGLSRRRRFAGFGSQCIDPNTSQFIDCRDVPVPIVGAQGGVISPVVQKSIQDAARKQAQASSSALLVPAALLGAALLLSRGKS